ncbi:MAG: hypothetical protein ABJA74_04665 [Lapillicoccus sp.]
MRAWAGRGAAAGIVLLAIAGCSAAPEPPLLTAAPTSGTGTSSGTGCPPTSLSSGPVTSQVVVVTTSASSAAGGSVLPVKTEIVVLSDGPQVVARPQWSALEVLGRGAVVARAVGSAGPDVPTPIDRGTTILAQTVPTQITLKGCNGAALTPGSYRLRALVGYASDALNTASGGPQSAFVMASESVDLTVT